MTQRALVQISTVAGVFQLQQYASDAGFVSGKGSSAVAGDAYWNTTIAVARFYDGSNWTSVLADKLTTPRLLQNYSISTSVASSALTITLQTAAAATAGATTPIYFGFRNATAGTGVTVFRSVTGALSLVIPSTTTIGMQSATATYMYVYALDNSGTVELAVSLSPFDEGSLQSTTAISGGTGSATLYSTSARSNVAVRLIGRILITEATAGTWASNATVVSLPPFEIQPPHVIFDSGGGQTINNTTATITWSSSNKVFDNWGMFVDANDNWVVKKAGLYTIGFTIRWGVVATGVSTSIAINGSVTRTHCATTASASNSTAYSCIQQLRLAVSDAVSLSASTGGNITTNDTTFFMKWEAI